MGIQGRIPMAGSTARSFATILLYIGACNLLFFFFLKTALFFPVGLAPLIAVFGWGLGFYLALFFFARIRLWGERQSFRSLVPMALLSTGFVAIMVRLASVLPTGIDREASWIRVEMIKTPLWLAMHIRHAPLFCLVLILTMLTLILLSVRAPKGRAPLIFTAVFFAGVVAFTVFFLAGAGSHFVTYVILFIVPTGIFWLLMQLRAFRWAVLLVPLVFHSVVTGAFYAGLVPGHLGRVGQVESIPGARVLHASSEIAGGLPFNHVRRLFLHGDRVYFSYGPMGGSRIAYVDRKTGESQGQYFPGLIRDATMSLDGRFVMALNWQQHQVMVLDADSLKLHCAADIGPLGLFTPWNFLVEPDRIYLTNMTLPTAAELVWEDADTCRISLSRSIHFREIGYTELTDGACSLYLDREKNRLYVTVAFLEGRYRVGLVEIDLETFTILRDLRLPGGIVTVRIPGTDRLLWTSYYYGMVHEVSLTTMKRVRVIRSDPTILAMAFDEKRGFAYGVSRTTGNLVVIDYETGMTIGRFFIGHNPEGLALDQLSDRLYVGGNLGILEIDLETFARALERPDV
jgi:hypothetical protein